MPLGLEVFHDVEELVVDLGLVAELNLDLIQIGESILDVQLAVLLLLLLLCRGRCRCRRRRGLLVLCRHRTVRGGRPHPTNHGDGR